MAHRLRCEPLEGRELLSGSPIPIPGPLQFHSGPIVADLTGDGIDDLVTRDQLGRVLLRHGLTGERFSLAETIGPAAEALALDGSALYARADDSLFRLSRADDGTFVATQLATGLGPLAVPDVGPSGLPGLDGEGLAHRFGPDLVGLAMSPLGMLMATRTGDVFRVTEKDGVPHRGAMLTARPVMAAADLDGDGRADVVVFDGTGGAPVVKLADGRSFAINAAGGHVPAGLTLADLNGDDLADLVICDEVGGRVLIHLGLGDGQFGPEVNDGKGFTVAPGPTFAAAGQLATGPYLGLVVVSTGSDQVSILLGQQTEAGWTMALGDQFTAGVRPTSAAIGELTGDAVPDLAIASGGDDTLRIVAGVGGGTFDPAGAAVLETGHVPYRVYLGDFDADGRTDVVSLNAGSNDLTFYSDSGRSGQEQRLSVGGLEPTAAAVRDVNFDGADDLVVSTYRSGGLSVLLGGSAGLSLAHILDTTSGLTGAPADESLLWTSADDLLWPTVGDTVAPDPATPPPIEFDFQPLSPGLVPLVPLWMDGTDEPAPPDEALILTSVTGRPRSNAVAKDQKPGGHEVVGDDAVVPEVVADEETPLNRFLLGAEEMPAPKLLPDGASEPPAEQAAPGPVPAGPVAQVEEEREPAARAPGEEKHIPPVAQAEEEAARPVWSGLLLAVCLPRLSPRRRRTPDGAAGGVLTAGAK